MKIKLSKNQWEYIGKMAGWDDQKRNRKWDQFDTMKSVRKPMPPPGKIMDDSRADDSYDPYSDRPSLSELKNEAEASCQWRGHNLGKWEDFRGKSRNISHNKCQICGKEVQVNDNPLPNEIDIGGEAVALGCEDKK